MSFKATTKQANKIKSIFDLLFQNTTTACFVIDARGIRSENITSQETLIKVDLPRNLFDEYTFTFDEPQYVGLGSHVNSFFKSVKNKNRLVFRIDKPFILDIDIQSNNEDVMVSLSVNMEIIQNIASSDYGAYQSSPILISSSSFSQMCKSFKQQYVNVTKRDAQVSFSCGITNISNKKITFGKLNADDKTLYHNTFKSDQFTRLSKMATFSDGDIELYVEQQKPVKLVAASIMGTMCVYVKPNQ